MNKQKEIKYKVGDLVMIHLPHRDSSWAEYPVVVPEMSSANGKIHRVLKVGIGSPVTYMLNLEGRNYMFIERWLRPVHAVVNIYTKNQNEKEIK